MNKKQRQCTLLYWYKNGKIAITWCRLYFILFSIGRYTNETQTVTNVIEIILIKNNN